jgi:hypothetical protein
MPVLSCLPPRLGFVGLVLLGAVLLAACECGQQPVPLSETTQQRWMPYQAADWIVAQDSAGQADTMAVAEQFAQQLHQLDCYQTPEDGEDYAFYRLLLRPDSSIALAVEAFADVQGNAQDSLRLRLSLPGRRHELWLYRSSDGAYRLDTGRTHPFYCASYNCNCCLQAYDLALRGANEASYLGTRYTGVTELRLTLSLADSTPPPAQRLATAGCSRGAACPTGCAGGERSYTLAFADNGGLVYYAQTTPLLSFQRRYTLLKERAE